MSKQVYHVGMYAEEKKTGLTAVFQFRTSKDYLSCEILEYYGHREQTKQQARKLAMEQKDQSLEALNILFAGYCCRRGKKFTSIKIN